MIIRVRQKMGKLKQWKEKNGEICLNVLKYVWVVCIVGLYVFGIWTNKDAIRQAEAADIAALVICMIVASGIAVFTFFRPVLSEKAGHIAGIISLFVLPYVSFCLTEWLFQNPFRIRIAAVVSNYFIYLSVYLVAFAVTNRYKFAIIIGNTITFLAGIVNYFVLLFRGTPFCPWDIFSVGTAADVLEGYTFTVSLNLLGGILSVVLINMWAWFLKGKIRKLFVRVSSAIAVVFGAGIMIYVLFLTPVLENCGITPNLFMQQVGYEENGYILGFCLNIRYIQVNTPGSYSVEKVEEILDTIPDAEEVSQAAVKPNIIMIMNEAYADLEDVGEFETNIDYMPFVRGLTENTVTGDMYVSVYGGGTSNTEYEVLTGNSMAFLANGSIPYQQYISSKYKTGGMVSNLKEQGYVCYAVHPMAAGNWERDVVYESMGFDEFYDIESFSNQVYIRGVLTSDWDTYRKVMELLKGKESQDPVFIFNVTVQNHGGYTYGTEFEEAVEVEDMEQEYPKVNEYLSLMKLSDNALIYLIEELQQFEEPTLVVLFGDHHPAVEEEFYEELIGRPMQEWNIEELQKRYQVPLLIWANYDIEEGDLGALSANRLASVVYEYAGLKMPKYFEYQKKLSQKIPVLNVNGYMDEKNVMHTHTENSGYESLLEEYRILNYNSAVDRKNTVELLYADE